MQKALSIRHNSGNHAYSPLKKYQICTRNVVDMHVKHRVLTLLLANNPGRLQDTWEIFQDLFRARECLNIKKK